MLPELSTQVEALVIESRGNTTLKKNYLPVAHDTQGNYKKAIEANPSAPKEHTDYLFARLNEVHVCGSGKKYKKCCMDKE